MAEHQWIKLRFRFDATGRHVGYVAPHLARHTPNLTDGARIGSDRAPSLDAHHKSAFDREFELTGNLKSIMFRTVDGTVLRGLEALFMALYSLVRAFFEAPRERAPNFV